MVVKGEACASFADCKSCYNSSFYCHWCAGDSACHAVGSPYGCVYGTSCFNNDQCYRQEAEFDGYAFPAFGVYLGVGLVGGTLLMCGIASIMLARDYAKSSADSSSARLLDSADCEYELMPGGNPPDETDTTSLIASAPPIPSNDKESAERDGGREAAREGRPATWKLRRRPSSTPAQTMTPFARSVYFFVRFVCSSCLIITLALSGLVIFFAPHTPQINVCNTEFDWSSIVHSIKRAGIEADFQLLVSVYNPNRMDLLLKGGSAVFRHHHTEVGEMYFSNLTARGGYITDVLLPVQFDAEAWENLNLGYEYETGSLSFLVDGTISAAISVGSMESYPLSFSFSNYYIHVSDATNYDRSLCHCPRMSD